MTARRLEHAGWIDRKAPVSFTFEGRNYSGFAGDTLASALLASGIRVIGRSFKYHRPRGLMAAGVEEPNALMQVGEGAQSSVNLRATEVELREGLVAKPVNCWPSARFDVMAVNNLFSRFIPAGFYYKTFIWPDWHLFEPFIRKAAGLGRPSAQPDPDQYEIRHAHCDVLVVGSGPAGLSAALSAARQGQRVILAEQDFCLGGSALWQDNIVDGMAARDWAEQIGDEIQTYPDTRVLTRTTAIAYADHNCVTLVERVSDHLIPGDSREMLRQRLWTVRAKHVVLATGAFERPIVFPGNDRPGVMLADSITHYINRFGVLPGQQIALFTNNDSAYLMVDAVIANGGVIAAVVDCRAQIPDALILRLAALNVPLFSQAEIIETQGRPDLTSITVRRANGTTQILKADVLAMSGGWNPAVHLFSQSGGHLKFDAARACFLPDQCPQALTVIGGAAGEFDLATSLAKGWVAGRGHGPAPQASAMPAWSITPLWQVQAPGKAFVDFQNDATAADIALAKAENFQSVEHLKRYTTLGMAPDQGKTSNVNALAIMAELTGRPVEDTGTTRFRPPFTPTAIAAFGGMARGDLFRPKRQLVLHNHHRSQGAVFEDYGNWQRPAYHLRAGETPHQAEQREALCVRQDVGIFDSSTLGKIEVAGPDAGKFLDRFYANRMSNLKVGRLRYGLMLNELGVIIDDGVCARLAEDRFLVGTTSSGAGKISASLEEWRQCEWPDLKVLIIPVTTLWNVITISGPKARALLSAAQIDMSVSADDFPHMSFKIGQVAGIPARVFRVSYTGEISYEINVEGDDVITLWQRLIELGPQFGLMPVGIDAWQLLRTEKGFLHIGADTDGSTVPDDVGWGHVLKRTDDFIGKRSLTQPGNQQTDRLQFVGLEPTDAAATLAVGGHLRGSEANRGSEGYITSAGHSPVLGRSVALGMVRAGRARLGETMTIVSGENAGQRVRLVAPGAYDPKGERLAS